MKIVKKRLICLMAAGCIACLSVACGNSNASNTEKSMSSNASETLGVEPEGGISSGTSYDGMEMEGETAAGTENAGTEEGAVQVSGSQSQSQKLIKTVEIEAETKEYDTLVSSVTKEVNQLNGYIEESVERHRGEDRGWCSMTIRIPCESLDAFLNHVSQSANVLSKSVNTEDVTLAYVDMQSHIKALRTEEETLLGLLERAEKLSDVITLQNELTSVRYQIESYESQIRTYDNLVRYSTVHLTVEEVERETPVQEEKSFLAEIRSGLSDNLYDIGMAFRNCAVWAIISLPYFAIIGVIAAVVILVVRKIRKRRKKGVEP